MLSTVIKTAEKHANHSATNISFIFWGVFWGVYSRLADSLMFNYGFYNILFSHGLLEFLNKPILIKFLTSHDQSIDNDTISISMST